MSGRLMNSQLMSVLGFSSAQFDESLQQCLDAALSSKKFLQTCQARFDEAFGQGHDAADLVRARASLVDQFVMALYHIVWRGSLTVELHCRLPLKTLTC